MRQNRTFLDSFSLLELSKREYQEAYRGGILLPDHVGIKRKLSVGGRRFWGTLDEIKKDGAVVFVVARDEVPREVRDGT